jgi:hypothetical protein
MKKLILWGILLFIVWKIWQNKSLSNAAGANKPVTETDQLPTLDDVKKFVNDNVLNVPEQSLTDPATTAFQNILDMTKSGPFVENPDIQQPVKGLETSLIM